MKIGRTVDRPLLAALRPRPTVRWRLTLLYSFLFVICGAALLAITYWLFANFAYTPPKPRFGPGGTPPSQASLNVVTAMSVQRSIGLHRLQLYSGIALAFMAVVSSVLGWVMAGRVLAPLRTMTATAERISDTNLHERLAMPGPKDELRLLADTIDRLLARLETAFEAQRRFVANASHELRTPLAMMRTTLDVAIAKPGAVPAQTHELDAELRVDLDHADQLLECFLTLARAQNGPLDEHNRVALEPLVTAALSARARQIAAKRLTVETHLAPVEVAGSATLLGAHDRERDRERRAPQPAGRLDRAQPHTAWRPSGASDDRQQRPDARPGSRRAARPTVQTPRAGPNRIAERPRARAVDRRRRRRRARRQPRTPSSRRRRSPRPHYSPSANHPTARGRRHMRVLVVEDMPRHANRIAEGLRDQEIAVDVAYDGPEAVSKVNLNPYEVVVLDRDLPGIHGDQLCQIITHSEDPPMILMLTAAGTPGDRVKGLALGADDYLPKPFHFPELVLRIRALARGKPTARSRILQAAGIELDPLTGTVTRDGQTIELTPKERALLEALLKASPGALSAERLLEQAWDENVDPFTNTVKVTIARLRRKLGQPDIIHTTPGIGYSISQAT